MLQVKVPELGKLGEVGGDVTSESIVTEGEEVKGGEVAYDVVWYRADEPDTW